MKHWQDVETRGAPAFRSKIGFPLASDAHVGFSTENPSSGSFEMQPQQSLAHASATVVSSLHDPEVQEGEMQLPTMIVAMVMLVEAIPASAAHRHEED